MNVTSIKFGPYDNGHIIVGLSSGTVVVYDPITLEKLYEKQIFESEIN